MLLLLLLWAQAALAETSVRDSFQNGHNLTVTSDTLPAGHCSIGVPVTACGITDGFSLGVSPWMYFGYNMHSLAARVRLLEEESGHKLALQADYFRTFRKRDPTGGNAQTTFYEMEAVWLMLIRTWNVNPHYRLHMNGHLNYYFHERLPFSLRRPYINPSPWQVNLSLLHELDLAAGFFLYGEMGLLDLLNRPLHLHSGASLGWRHGGFSARMGFSLTGTHSGLFAPVTRRDYQQSLRFSALDGYESTASEERVRHDYAIHPEFSLQYTF